MSASRKKRRRLPPKRTRPVFMEFSLEIVFCRYCGRSPQQHFGDCRHRITGVTA